MGFSSFRELMNLWDSFKYHENISNEINALIDSQEFVLFFEKDKDIFGANEESRIVFAKLKSPDGELPKGWADEATFSALNLTKTLTNDDSSQQVFGKKDLKKINIIERSEALNKLTKQKSSKNNGNSKFQIITVSSDKDRDQAANFIQTTEKE